MFSWISKVLRVWDLFHHREKLDKVYDKLKFKRQEEAALVMDLQQV